MKNKGQIYLLIAISFMVSCQTSKQLSATDAYKNKSVKNDKLIIYQLLPRLFGNTVNNNKTYGSKEENGCGKFNDINDKALQALKGLGITHVWYTGVIEHATMTDYTSHGIKMDDPDVVKGIAGSPYAIKDYYDIDPDLAVDVKNRIGEYESLIKRTHKNGLKVIMDFIPNHVARTYYSDARPDGISDFGSQDDYTKSFSPRNDFYYIPGSQFQVPAGYIAGGTSFNHPLKDASYQENPAKATGNNIFKQNPTLDDWFETIKLNYGWDPTTNTNHFNPNPPVWFKMRDILIYWTKKGVDGFRCDVAEMVPVEFWAWVIPEIKKVNPEIVFIGEAYDPKQYEKFIAIGKFDYLYDKVGLYDGLKRLIRDEKNANVADISYVIQKESVNIPNHMLRFLENHDEERIASKGFAQNATYSLPAMVVSALLGTGPVMIYFGQEVGEPGEGIEGFGGDDNRTSIFDYWGVPNHQRWVNGGEFDGGKLTDDQRKLRLFYQKLLTLSGSSDCIKFGVTTSLNDSHQQQELFGKKVFGFTRSYQNQHMLVLANFDRNQAFDKKIRLDDELVKSIGSNSTIHAENLMTGEKMTFNNFKDGITLHVNPSDYIILNITK